MGDRLLETRQNYCSARDSVNCRVERLEEVRMIRKLTTDEAFRVVGGSHTAEDEGGGGNVNPATGLQIPNTMYSPSSPSFAPSNPAGCAGAILGGPIAGGLALGAAVSRCRLFYWVCTRLECWRSFTSTRRLR
jgi:hypothetical protein